MAVRMTPSDDTRARNHAAERRIQPRQRRHLPLRPRGRVTCGDVPAIATKSPARQRGRHGRWRHELRWRRVCLMPW